MRIHTHTFIHSSSTKPQNDNSISNRIAKHISNRIQIPPSAKANSATKGKIACTHNHTHQYTHKNAYAISINANTHMQTHSRTHTNTHVYTHIHTHTIVL